MGRAWRVAADAVVKTARTGLPGTPARHRSLLKRKQPVNSLAGERQHSVAVPQKEPQES
jgi:hypothetical protein